MEDPHDQRADELERQADVLEQHGEGIDRMARETREDWESKKSSEGTPGATEPAAAAPGGLGEDEDEDEDEQDEDES